MIANAALIDFLKKLPYYGESNLSLPNGCKIDIEKEKITKYHY